MRKKMNEKDRKLLSDGIKNAVLTQFHGKVEMFEVLRQSHECLSLIFAALVDGGARRRAAGQGEAQNTSTNKPSTPCRSINECNYVNDPSQCPLPEVCARKGTAHVG